MLSLRWHKYFSKVSPGLENPACRPFSFRGLVLLDLAELQSHGRTIPDTDRFFPFFLPLDALITFDYFLPLGRKPRDPVRAGERAIPACDACLFVDHHRPRFSFLDRVDRTDNHAGSILTMSTTQLNRVHHVDPQNIVSRDPVMFLGACLQAFLAAQATVWHQIDFLHFLSQRLVSIIKKA
jgi:hypothetical protein